MCAVLVFISIRELDKLSLTWVTLLLLDAGLSNIKSIVEVSAWQVSHRMGPAAPHMWNMRWWGDRARRTWAGNTASLIWASYKQQVTIAMHLWYRDFLTGVYPDELSAIME